VKLKENGIEFTFHNILAPMTIEDVPEGDEYLSKYSIKIDGNEVPIEMMQQATVIVNDKEYASTNIAELNGEIIPLGGTITIFAPVTEFGGKELQKGEEHEFHVAIAWRDDKSKIEYGPITRTIQ
jgi:hypothetical protein